MINSLEYKIDKFTFRIPTDRYYTEEGLWILPEGTHARVGISDFLQQRSGDMAFVEVKPVGETIVVGKELVVIETIKVNISLTSPISGKVIEVNPMMETSPEVINQDPYELGWIVVMEPFNLQSEISHLLDPQAYFTKVKRESERDIKKDL